MVIECADACAELCNSLNFARCFNQVTISIIIISRYRQYIEIFSFVIFRLWDFPLYFFFLSCNSLRKPPAPL